LIPAPRSMTKCRVGGGEMSEHPALPALAWGSGGKAAVVGWTAAGPAFSEQPAAARSDRASLRRSARAVRALTPARPSPRDRVVGRPSAGKGLADRAEELGAAVRLGDQPHPSATQHRVDHLVAVPAGEEKPHPGALRADSRHGLPSAIRA